ncbi:MAG: LemA family protein [Spirochaetaceae bacterium]|jgi:LemA protein|nr:LemA family protein [Spirochaetaceae bacterium]
MKSFSVKIYLLILFSLFLTGCGYNMLFRFEENIERSWESCIDLFDKRDELLSDYLNWIDSRGFPGDTLINRIQQHRSILFSRTVVIFDKGSMTSYLMLQADLVRYVSLLDEELEQWDQLQKDWKFQEIHRSLEENNREMALALNEYNGYVDQYKGFLLPLHRKLLAQWLGFQDFQKINIEVKDILLPLGE